MIANASVILLDLREYSQQRKGTRFELTELLRHAPIDKVVLLIDAKENVHGLATNAGTAIAALHEELPQVSAIFVFLVIRSSPQMDRTGKSDRDTGKRCLKEPTSTFIWGICRSMRIENHPLPALLADSQRITLRHVQLATASCNCPAFADQHKAAFRRSPASPERRIELGETPMRRLKARLNAASDW